ncbi:MAG: hypothetical protein QM760_17915 [Nibricoccus sp.]
MKVNVCVPRRRIRKFVVISTQLQAAGEELGVIYITVRVSGDGDLDWLS